ncbi:MAG TPA: hypothetical protein VN903_20095 [Polyangia bacterium]|nr:hypothetical protein [Polyangia bacterium]
MNNDARTQAKVKLAEVVKRVMADGKIDASEREEMKSVYSLLTVTDIKEVLTGYLAGVRDEVLADGQVSEEERARCRRPRRAEASAGARARGLSSAALILPTRSRETRRRRDAHER